MNREETQKWLEEAVPVLVKNIKGGIDRSTEHVFRTTNKLYMVPGVSTDYHVCGYLAWVDGEEGGYNYFAVVFDRVLYYEKTSVKDGQINGKNFNTINPYKATSGEKYFTDYPFVELGDIQYTEAPVRQVTFLEFDGDRYCDIKFGGKVLTVKSGYLYYSPQRITDDGLVDVENFETDPTL